jgi:5-enolpyruvylshikimate-3-phosphate synthase
VSARSVREEGDMLNHFARTVCTVRKSRRNGDHRIAMCFAMIGLRIPGIRIKKPVKWF